MEDAAPEIKPVVASAAPRHHNDARAVAGFTVACWIVLSLLTGRMLIVKGDAFLTGALLSLVVVPGFAPMLAFGISIYSGTAFWICSGAASVVFTGLLVTAWMRRVEWLAWVAFLWLLVPVYCLIRFLFGNW